MRATVLVALSVFAVPVYAQVDASANRAPFAVVADWPKLPADFAMGQAAGVDVDQEGDVWIFHRGKKMPIMEFDAQGDLTLSGEGCEPDAFGQFLLRADVEVEPQTVNTTAGDELSFEADFVIARDGQGSGYLSVWGECRPNERI